MRSFRFPRSAILLMVATFLTILGAISLATEMARTVQTEFGGPNLPAMWWSRLPGMFVTVFLLFGGIGAFGYAVLRSEEHTSELQSLRHLVCRLLLETKKRRDLGTELLYVSGGH